MTKKKQSTEPAVREIRRRTRRKFSPEERIRIVLEGLRGEQSISELCRRDGIAASLYHRRSKDFPWRPARRSWPGTRSGWRPVIERFHRVMKAVVKLQHHYFPWELEAVLTNGVACYDNERSHASLDTCLRRMPTIADSSR